MLYLGTGPLTDVGITPFHQYPNGNPPPENATFKYGLLPSTNFNHTANTTAVAAVTAWHFAQAWFSAFPEYKTSDSRVSIWGNSYAGFWVPATAAYTVVQNAKIASGKIDGVVINVDTIGLLNGCIDLLYQAEAYVH